MYVPPWRRGGVVAIFPSMGLGIDTLEYAKRLRDAGFSELQAEGQAQALAAAMTDTLATRTDFDVLGSRIDGVDGRLGLRIDELEKRLGIRIDEVEKRLDARIDEVEKRLEARIDEVEKRLEARLDEVEKRLEARLDEVEKRLSSRMDALEERVGRLEERVGRLEERIGVLSERVGALEQRCELGFAEMCSRTDLAHLERRMTMRLGGMMVAGIGVVSAVVGMI